jgi:iron complex transport system substrate-binding protein
MRVVTLIASATEIVTALGAFPQLVGRSHECDYPPDVAGLPQLTEAKLPLHGDSGEIDAEVKRVVAEGLSVYRVDADALKALSPDVIVTQDQCEVCAVSLRDVEQATCGWTGHECEIVSLRPDNLADIFSDILRVAAALQREKDGARLVAQLKGRIDSIARQAQRTERRPRVALIEWCDPLMTGGNWMPELVTLAGGENLFGETGKHSPYLEWEAVRRADPDVILIHPCGYDLKHTLEDARAMQALPGWADLVAVRAGDVFAADGNAFFNRPGPRIVESLEILAEILHPDLFDFGHEGEGWVRLSPAS